MLSSKEIAMFLGGALGPLETEWEAASAKVVGEESFTIIRYDNSLKKGQLRRIHSMIEDLLSRELSQGDREGR